MLEDIGSVLLGLFLPCAPFQAIFLFLIWCVRFPGEEARQQTPSPLRGKWLRWLATGLVLTWQWLFWLSMGSYRD